VFLMQTRDLGPVSGRPIMQTVDAVACWVVGRWLNSPRRTNHRFARTLAPTSPLCQLLFWHSQLFFNPAIFFLLTTQVLVWSTLMPWESLPNPAACAGAQVRRPGRYPPPPAPGRSPIPAPLIRRGPNKARSWV